jgi:hypothetical protein
MTPNHPIYWFAPQPLWRAIPRAQLAARRGQPTILRFANDNFMEELVLLLATGRGAELRHYVVQPETWRVPDSGLDAAGNDKPGELKLYQPSHGRYYLVVGALACAIPGVPDRTVDVQTAEAVFCVLRRNRNGQEAGWATGLAGGSKGWHTVIQPDNSLLPDEERIPLFPLSFSQDGTTRRLLAGLVPVARRESYQDVPTPTAPGPDRYVMRLVYARPACKSYVISAPTRAFQMASFFDPDAPARAIRMTMPIDTSPEGLGKYDKNFNVLISNQLQAQINRIKGLKELLEGDIDSETPLDLGMICSFSIPIITICALILLMIIVNLLNILFFWLPFFRICLPIPLRSE